MSRATKLLAKRETLAQLADIEKVAIGLRGRTGPAGGADFFGLHAKMKSTINQRFPNDFCDQTISLGLGAGEIRTLETLKLLSFWSLYRHFKDFKAFEFLKP